MTTFVRRLDAQHKRTFGAGMRNFAYGSEAAAQRVMCRLLELQGDEPLDTSSGLPWWQDPSTGVRPIMGVPRDLGYSESLIKRQILESDGIASMSAFDSSFDPETRKWTVIAAEGETVDGEPWTIQEVTF